MLARGFTNGPLSWPLVRAGDLFELRYGKSLVETSRRPGGVPVYGTNGQCGWHDSALFAGPGVILGRKGQGHLGVEWSDVDFWVIDTAYALAVRREDVGLRFAYYLIKYIGLNHLKDGTSNPSLSRDTFGAQAFPLPPLREQLRITEVLAVLDEKIELNRRMNETLEAMARALFKSWFVDFDHSNGAMPDGWRHGALDELQAQVPHAITAGPFGSKLGRADYVDDGVPVIRGTNLGSVAGEWFQESDFVYVSAEKASHDLASCIARPGDVLFTQRGTLGQIGMVPLDATYAEYVISQSQMKMTCAEWVPPEYVVLAFKQPQAVAYIEANAVAVGVPHINLGFLRKFSIIIPSRRTLADFTEIVRPLHQRMRSNVVESRTLAELRDLLLPKLLSGDLRVRDAERAVEAVA
jgi:type I restriction enzyme S subunit